MLPWLVLFLLFTASAQGTAKPLPEGGSLDEFDNLQWLPAREGKPARLVLGDTHGLLHVCEERDGAFAEVWLSRYLEGAINGLFIADANGDSLQELVVFTDQGRFYYLDSEAYNLLWSNSPGEYDKITAQTIANVDDDLQPELIFCAAGRLVIYDGRDHYEEWRSEQTQLASSDILVADVDGDGQDEIVLSDGYVFDARFHTLEWQSPESFGERLAVLDLDADGILELLGEFKGRFIRIFDIDLRREKFSKP